MIFDPASDYIGPPNEPLRSRSLNMGSFPSSLNLGNLFRSIMEYLREFLQPKRFGGNVTYPFRVVLLAAAVLAIPAAIVGIGAALLTAVVTLGVVGGAFYLLFKSVGLVS
jgi:hypothetical protein